MDIQAAIAESRLRSRIGNYAEALDVLIEAQSSKDVDDTASELQAELNRIYLILGNHKAISVSVPSPNSVCGDLIAIQSALSLISTTLDLDSSLRCAASLFHKHMPGLGSEQESQHVPMILYYCVEMHYFWRLCGDGIDDPGFTYDSSFLQPLVLRLLKSSFYYEALEIMEHFSKNPVLELENLASCLLAESNPVLILCMLVLARIHARQGRLEDAEGIVGVVEDFIDEELGTARHDCRMIKLRFLEGEKTKADRVGELIQLSITLREFRHYNMSSQALEYAAEIAETLPDARQATIFGQEIHDELRKVWSESGDQLNLTFIEFRFCDFLNSSTTDFAAARVRRNELLSSPLSQKFPCFQRFHKRQWAEYFMLHQRERALYHAERYLEYCKKCRDEEEQSLAENIRFQTLLQPYRTSEDKRIDVLEDICSQLRKGIKNDAAKSWYGALAEKQLLLVEALAELGRLQEEDSEDIAVEAREILREAQDVSENINGKADNAFVKYEIAFLKTSASLFLDGQPLQQSTPLISLEDDKPLSDSQGSFNSVFWLHLFLLSLKNESLQTFERMFNELTEQGRTYETAETTIKQAKILSVKAMICYLLLEFDGPKIQQFRLLAGFSSMKQGAKLVLRYLEQAFDLRDQLEQEARDKSEVENRSEALAASQAYFTGELEQLYFDIALELAFGLQDKNLTWKWIQRRKSRAITTMLRSSTPEGKPASRSDALGGASFITFEDLQFIQTASVSKLVFVDWIIFGTSPAKLLFFSFCMGRDAEGPIAIREMFEIEASLEELKKAAENIDERRMNYDDAERYLRPFIPVIQPLERCCNEGDILILSLTAPLHNVPLHAVSLDFKPLIERNPVLYVPSHSALISCLQRLAAPEPGAAVPTRWKAAIFGAYDDTSSASKAALERTEIYGSLKALGSDLDCTPVLGKDLTEASLKEASSSCKLIHFHGHGISDPHSPSQQSLALGPSSQPLTIPSITSLNLKSAHVTLIACSGGKQDFSLSGDEPLGLLSSFLVGGASSVIGALWPIQSSTGRLFTEVFYEYFLRHVDRTELGPVVNLARGLQHTVLEIWRRKETDRLYHWAPFVLYGVWFCGRKPGSW